MSIYDLEQKCTYKLGTKEKCPHISIPRQPRKLICDNALDIIGNTPMVRLNKIPRDAGIKCEMVAKCEYFNAGGSVKDRIGKRMVEEAEISGRLKKGDTIIEPTSGNTGIGLALAAAIKGYRCIITLPEKMSQEKVDVLKGLGAEIVRTPTEAAWDSPDSHIGVASKLQAEIPNSHILDQYSNTGNPMAHYEGTAEEIWEQCEGRIDMIVMTAGTGGTIAGVARKLKEYNPNIIVVGVDPYGSILAQPEELNKTDITTYAIEGIGYDFLPRVCNRDNIDRWVKTRDKESFIMARRLIREEGLLCGGSSGSAMVGALQAAATLGEGQRCVVLFADSIRNYMTKHLSDSWMYEHGFVSAYDEREVRMNEWWASKSIADLGLQTPITVTPETSCKDAIQLMTSLAFDMVPVVSGEDGNCLGVITEGNLTKYLTNGKVKPDDSCVKAVFKQFRRVNVQSRLGDLACIFDKDYYALVVAEQRIFSAGKETVKSIVCGVVTRIDLLNFISKGM